jgi:hypothetical protein
VSASPSICVLRSADLQNYSPPHRFCPRIESVTRTGRIVVLLLDPLGMCRTRHALSCAFFWQHLRIPLCASASSAFSTPFWFRLAHFAARRANNSLAQPNGLGGPSINGGGLKGRDFPMCPSHRTGSRSSLHSRSAPLTFNHRPPHRFCPRIESVTRMGKLVLDPLGICRTRHALSCAFFLATPPHSSLRLRVLCVFHAFFGCGSAALGLFVAISFLRPRLGLPDFGGTPMLGPL